MGNSSGNMPEQMDGGLNTKKYDFDNCKAMGTDDLNLNCIFQQQQLDAGYVMLENYVWVRKDQVVRFYTSSTLDKIAVLKDGTDQVVWLDDVDTILHGSCRAIVGDDFYKVKA